MTREEFVSKHADKYITALMRALRLDHDSYAAGKYAAKWVDDTEKWLGELHDTLTEIVTNAQFQKQPQGQPGAPGPASPPAKPAPARGPTGSGRGAA